MKEKFWKCIDEDLLLIFFVTITIFGVMIRGYFFDFESADYISFLQGWFSELKERWRTFGIKK